MEKLEQEKKFQGKKDFAKGAKRGKDRKFKEKKVYEKGPNDPIWRTSDETMTKLVASLPFGIPAGLTTEYTNEVDPTPFTFVQPGILTMPVIISAGRITDYNSAANLAVRKIYSYVRHANSGSKNYEAADMGMYFIAIGQVIGLLSYLQRCVRTAHEFSTTNRYTPRALLKSMGIDGDDMMSNLPNYKYLVAWLGRAIGSLAFPDLPYFHAIYEAFKYVYVDNDSPKEQLYLITPFEIGKYDPVYNSAGGGVWLGKGSVNPNIALPDAVTPLKYVDIYNLVKDRMDVLLGDEDIGIISGDILKAFKDGGLYSPQAFDLDYPLFQHSPELLQQIHNMTAINESAFIYTGIKQNPGGTGTAPYLEQDVNALTDQFSDALSIASATVIDAFSREPDAKEVVNCMVLNPQIKIKDSTTVGKYEYDAGSVSHDLFIPTTPFVTADVTSGTGISVVDLLDKRPVNISTLPGTASLISSFDWHPIIWARRGTAIHELKPLGDLQNVRIFTYDVGYRIHENSMLCLFNFKDHNFY